MVPMQHYVTIHCSFIWITEPMVCLTEYQQQQKFHKQVDSMQFAIEAFFHDKTLVNVILLSHTVMYGQKLCKWVNHN